MKKTLFFLFVFLVTIGEIIAQERRMIFYNGNSPVHTQLIQEVDSVCFVNNISVVHNNIGQTNFQFPVIGIDSIVFSMADAVLDTGDIIFITYQDDQVDIINPWANRGVAVMANGAEVVVNAASGYQDIVYYLSGSTQDGSLLINSDHRIKMIMNGVSIANSSSAAIKSVNDVKIAVTLENMNSLSDGATSMDKAAFDSEGQIVFSGDGTLSVAGNAKHGIFSNDYIRVLSGNIQVLNAVKDGIHADYFQMYTGTVDIANAKSGIDGDKGFISISGGTIDIDVNQADGKGLTCDSTVSISGGTIHLTLSGDYSKGIKAGKGITLDDGEIDVVGSGITVVSNNNPSHCVGLKSDADVTINGGELTVSMSNVADGGKGISADGNVFLNGGKVDLSVAGAGGTYINGSNQSDNYSAICVKSNGNIEVNNANVDVALNVSGKDGKGFSADNAIIVNDGNVSITLTGNASKGMKADGLLSVAGGSVDLSANGATVLIGGNPSYCTGLKSEGTLEVTGGKLNLACGSSNTGGRCISSTGKMTISGGYLTLSTQGNGATYTNSSNKTDGYGPICIKCDADLSMTAGVIDCQSSGTGGRGIKVEGNTLIGLVGADDNDLDIDIQTSGAPVGGSGGGGGGGFSPGGGSGSSNYCKPKGLKCLGDITINSGHISSYCAQTSGDPTGEAIEAKGTITITGGYVEANAYDDAINSGTGFNVSGGYVWAYARGNDGIDNNGTSTAQATNLTGGIIIVAGTEEAIDANIDRGGSFYINGATIIGFYSGNGGMGVFDNPSYLNGQKYILPLGTSTSPTTGTSYCVKNSADQEVMIYKHPAVTGSGFSTQVKGFHRSPPGGGGGAPGSSGGKFYFTSPDIVAGTYKSYTNPTITGSTNWHGLYIGASASTSGTGTSVTAQ
ncbi:MAG: carbohydrate-binding domain-containing protein [Bacteroidales bacterium]|nr:carbohydrate-binding domain-containing protein [Bacteroidales bacterium]